MVLNSRVRHLQERLEEKQAVLLCTPEQRIFYLNFMSSAGTLFITREKRYFLVDFRYIEAAAKIGNGFAVVLQKGPNPGAQMKALATELGLNEILVDSDTTTLTALYEISSWFAPACKVISGRGFSGFLQQKGQQSEEEQRLDVQCKKIWESSVSRLRHYIHKHTDVLQLRETLAVLRSQAGDESATLEADFMTERAEGKWQLLSDEVKANEISNLWVAFSTSRSNYAAPKVKGPVFEDGYLKRKGAGLQAKSRRVNQ